MFELRFGSYSIDATFAGTPTLSRRKSTWRYCFLWPPPRCHTTISPWLLRPPERFFGSSNDFSGVSLVIWLLSRTVINRRDAVYGLKLFSPIATSYLFALSDFNAARHELRCLLPWAECCQAGFCKTDVTNSPRTRSFFRLRRASRTLASSPCGTQRSGRGDASCPRNSPYAHRRP